MSVIGIVAEFNPFHNGHKYLIDYQRKKERDSTIIAVMSGNFTQRGEISILDKWNKAQIAIENGVDIVVELPVVFASRSAEYFAKNSIRLFKELNCVDKITCGAEISGEILQKIATNISDNQEFNDILKNNLQNGNTYAKAIALTLDQCNLIDEDFNLPNSILALEYLKANINLKTPFDFDIISRRQAFHHDDKIYTKFASGSAIRKSVYSNKVHWDELSGVMPIQTLVELKNSHKNDRFPNLEILGNYLLMKLRLMKIYELEKIYGMHDGMANRILQMARKSENYMELINNIKTKRYTFTHISRLMIYIALNFQKESIGRFDTIGPQYIRVLGFSSKGQALINKIKKNLRIPIITKASSFLNTDKIQKYSLDNLQEMLSYDIMATDFYRMLQNDFESMGEDFYKNVIRIIK